MKKLLLTLLPALLALTGCEIEGPDFFVPEVSFTEADARVSFTPDGGIRTFDIEANCDWSIACPADWVELSVTDGELNATLQITVAQTKLPRNTTVTLYSNEVESRQSVISIEQSGVVEISTVSTPVASNTTSASGTTASLRASYTSISLSESDSVTAGFILTAGGASVDVAADVDRDTQTFSVSLTDLVQDTLYECVAWARLNDEPAVRSEPTSFRPTLLPAEIKTVAATEISGAKSSTGTTASFESVYTAVSLSDSDFITAGFVITAADGTTVEATADVDRASGKFSGSVSGLTAGAAYTVTAWACLNDAPRVYGEPVQFATGIVDPQTIVADFTSNDLWGLPTANGDMKQEEVTVTDAKGYTWTILGGCINSNCLWLASDAKSGFNGYVILPQLKDLTVTSIDFPNDGKSPSGSARITIWVSNDNGASFEAVPECTGVAPGKFELTGQKPGAVYKIENVVDSAGKSGFSKTTKLTIEAE